MDNNRKKHNRTLFMLRLGLIITSALLIICVGTFIYVSVFPDFGALNSASVSSRDGSLTGDTSVNDVQSSAAVLNENVTGAGTLFNEGDTDTASATDTEDSENAAQGTPVAPEGFYIPENFREARLQCGLNDEAIAEIAAEQTLSYYYTHLTDSEKYLYCEIYFILTHQASDIYISTDSKDTLERVQTCVLNDHPEIYYVSGFYTTRYTLQDKVIGYTYSGNYLYDSAEITRREALIENYINTCLSGAPGGNDDYYNIKYIYEYIIDNTSYDLNSEDNQNICSVMLNGVSVCQGYAKAAQLLLNRLGIQCTLVVGTVSSETVSGSHAWNLVKSNGNWYYTDVTWGDASFTDSADLSSNIGYDYLLTTGADIFKTHTNGSVVAMPVCDHTEDNYYVREGAYFTEASLDAFAQLVIKRQSEGAAFVTFKCANDEVYNEMIRLLFDESGIFDYISRTPGQSVTYTKSDTNRSVTVWF